MLPLKTIFYIILLFFGIIGSTAYHPMIGIIGYLFTYNINPIGQWWGLPLLKWGIRYSLFLAVATGLGIILHRSKLRFNKLLENQEILLIIFLGLIWLSILLGFGFNPAESNAAKMTKVVIILLMASHIITDIKRYEIMLWTLILAGLYLGYETYIAPGWMFHGARLDYGIGGSDFSEGNFLGSHFAMLLPFIGVMFFKGGWKSKAVCLISGVLIVNAIILCRSRGVFLGVTAGIIVAVIFSVPGYRSKILAVIGIGLVGAILLTDPGFWTRMGTISANTSQMDSSSYGRIVVWKAALAMVEDHPLGIGEGNFKKYVGQYSPAIPGRDTHNTYFRCLAELGIQGLIIYLLLIINAFRILRRIKEKAKGITNETDFMWHIYGLKVSLIIFLICGITMTHTYIEELYWLLMFPVFLERSVENEAEQNG